MKCLRGTNHTYEMIKKELKRKRSLQFCIYAVAVEVDKPQQSLKLKGVLSNIKSKEIKSKLRQRSV